MRVRLDQRPRLARSIPHRQPSRNAMSDIIDTHTHVIATDNVKYPVAPLGGQQSTWSQNYPVDISGLIAAMDKAGVAKAVVVQASTVYGHDNRYAVEAVKTH